MNKFINLRYVGYQVQKNRRLMILIAVALSITYPMALMLASSGTKIDIYTVSTLKSVNIVIFLMLAALMPLLIFRYLTSKKDLDVYHALPIKSETLFVSNFVATILIVFIPEAVAWIFGFFVQMSNGLDPSVLHLLMELGIVFAYLPIIMFPAMLAINNIGTLFDSFVYASILQLMPFIAMLVVSLYGETYIFAENSIITPIVSSFISYHYAFVNSILSVTSEIDFYWSYILWPVLGVALILLNRYLYKVRSVENVERPKLNNWFTPIVAFILTVMVLLIALYSYNTGYSQRPIDFVYPIVTVLVMYLVLDAISHRGFAHFFKAIIEFAILLALSIGILFGMRGTNGFGFDYLIPEADEVESVVVSSYSNLTFMTQIRDYRENSISSNYYEYYETISDEESIEHVIDFHEYIVETYFEYFDQKNVYNAVVLDWGYGYSTADHPYNQNFESQYELNGLEPRTILKSNVNGYETYINIRLDYYLKDGDHTYRTYTVPVDWTYDLLELIIN